MEEKTPVCLVTANVGSIFEDPDSMINLWIQEFLQVVSETNSKFIALHCQEVGGKNYETRMQHVENFVKLLMSSEELKFYDKAVIFLDEDFSCAENFTALGSFYFIHESVTDVLIWDFEDLKFHPVEGKNVHSGNIETISIKEKSKFPQNFFPECKWSRKGYLRTRWSLNGTIFDLVNIHLFHDASNFVAMQSFPSVYTVTRQKALQYTLNRFYNYEEGSAPFFLFGDFNFRTDTRGVVKKLTSGLNECKENDSSNEDSKVEYKDDASEVVVTIGKKEFSHNDHQNVFVNDSGEWLKEFDREMDAFKDQLFEFPISFLPSYPFEENCSRGKSYMKTRCPAWCDRVLLSNSAKRLVYEVDNNENIKYSVIGKDSCMGDHKPVYLSIELVNGSGMVPSRLSFRNVCSACKLNSSVFSDTINESSSSPLKSHFSCSLRCDSTHAPAAASSMAATAAAGAATASSSSSKKPHHRNLTRCLDTTTISPMSTVTELSDQLSDTDNEIYYLASAISTLASNPSTDNDSNSKLNKEIEDKEGAGDAAAAAAAAKLKRFQFAEESLSLMRFYESCNSKEFIVSRSLDRGEDEVPIRANSAVNVVESSWRSKCYCLQDMSWRIRSVSSSSRTSSWNSDSRVRLKSDPNLKTSLPRIQSHHSSSDEEWFEEVAVTVAEETISTTTTTTPTTTAESVSTMNAADHHDFTMMPERRGSDVRAMDEQIEEFIEFEACPSVVEDCVDAAKPSVAAACVSGGGGVVGEKRARFVIGSNDVWQKPAAVNAASANGENKPVSSRHVAINQNNDNVIMKETTV